MARPTVIRDADILEAARAVFLERGALATSAEVAQRAGISEGSVFKRFRTKAELFRAAMGLSADDMPTAFASLPEQAGQGSIEDNLVAALLGAIAHADRTFPIMTMSLANPKLSLGIPEELDVPDAPPLRAQRVIASYLEREIEAGRLSRIDVGVTARAIFGAITGYVLSEALSARHGGSSIEREHFVRSYVAVLLHGALPREPVSPSRGVGPAPAPSLQRVPLRKGARAASRLPTTQTSQRSKPR
jgi:AcrR family transcriptional regulator